MNGKYKNIVTLLTFCPNTKNLKLDKFGYAVTMTKFFGMNELNDYKS